ncbi:MAG: AmmeMemoRadiSam system radical SAM enzyme [Acidobacteriota bacterium]|nr:AmmeMemoRadiSam system radical SAM enzyme [Acidobacteriota bacterium]
MIASTPAVQWRPAAFYRTDGDRLRCTLCPHECRLTDGETGYCRVRRRRGFALETATMASAVFHLDAVEKKPFYHYYPGTEVLTTAPPGCTMRCSYCINWKLSQYGRHEQACRRAEPVSAQGLADRAEAAGAAIAFSYSEPVLAAELTLALAALPRPPRVVWKTNGFMTAQAAARLAPHLDAVNIDLKCLDDAAHRRLTGAPVGPVLDTVETFLAAGVWVELSTPLIPGYSADLQAITAIAGQIRSWGSHIPWHLLRFSPDFRMNDHAPTHPDLLRRAVETARAEGLMFVYVERALAEAGRRTHCPRCHAVFLARDIQAARLPLPVGENCRDCGFAIPGRWVSRGAS